MPRDSLWTGRIAAGILLLIAGLVGGVWASDAIHEDRTRAYQVGHLSHQLQACRSYVEYVHGLGVVPIKERAFQPWGQK